MSYNIDHQHLAECTSTQDLLRSIVKSKIAAGFNGSFYELISTSNQTAGHGRGNNVWSHFSSNLAFSFTIPSHSVVTLTPLEMGVLVATFFLENFKIKIGLKWPNDLHIPNQGKVGGILCEKNDATVLVGIGINIGSMVTETSPQTKYPIATIPKDFFSGEFQKEVPLQIFKYIQDNRLDQIVVLKKWQELCVHIDRTVTCHESNSKLTGQFKRLGNSGQAIIQVGPKIEEIWSGSLLILE